MIVEDQRDQQDNSDDVIDFPSSIVVTQSQPVAPRSIHTVLSAIREIENTQAYFLLRDDIIDHLWHLHADA